MREDIAELIYRKNSTSIIEDKEKLRIKLEKDKEIFFKNGGKVEVCPIHIHNGRSFTNTNFKIKPIADLDQTIKYAQHLGRLNNDERSY
jgi:hypothetical protein